jgi:hypothetical protein
MSSDPGSLFLLTHPDEQLCAGAAENAAKSQKILIDKQGPKGGKIGSK